MGELSGAAYAIGAAGLFGMSTPAAKLLLAQLQPVMLAAALYLGAAIALSAYRLAAQSSKSEAPLTRRELPLMAAVAFFGGTLGPVLMLLGLRRVSAVSGSLLLNLEAPFTATIAVTLMREHLDARETMAAVAIMSGAALIGLRPGDLHSDWIGAAEMAAACLCWAVDNNLTQRLSLRNPVALSQFKTVASGICLWAIAWALGQTAVSWKVLTAAVVVGAFAYGFSILLDVKALRLLGAAREAAYFATAPFMGALLSAVVYRQTPGALDSLGALMMAAGVFLMVIRRHDHVHAHQPMVHEHLHYHDAHHQHLHPETVVEPHSHSHHHQPLVHAHPHASDLHHRH